MTDDIPKESWPLSRLAEFCNSLLRRNATDSWKLGKAFTIARAKHKKDKKWLQWAKAHICLSTATIYRYIETCDRLTLDDCENRSLKEVNAIIEDRKVVERSVRPSKPMSVPSRGTHSLSSTASSTSMTSQGCQTIKTSETRTSASVLAVLKPFSWAQPDEQASEIEMRLKQFHRSLANFSSHRGSMDIQRRTAIVTNLRILQKQIEAVISILDGQTLKVSA